MEEKSKKRPWKSRLPRLFIALIVLTVALELVLRFVFGLGHPLLYTSDPECGYLPAPNQHLYRFFAHNDINSLNMRSAPMQTVKPPDGIRILFVGDSVTYGQTYVDQPKIFTSILNSELPALLHRPVEVLNASAGGWAVGNELGYVKSRGVHDADLVIFVINTLDMTQPFNDDIPGLELSLDDHNPPFAIAEAWTRYIKPRIFHQSDADRGSQAPVAGSSQTVEQTIGQLEEAHQRVIKAGARFAIAYSPVRETVGEQFVPLHGQSFPLLKQWADGANVPLLDLEQAYKSATFAATYHDAIHLSPGGHAVVAKAIEQWPLIHEYDKSAK